VGIFPEFFISKFLKYTSKQVEQRKTAIHETIHHYSIIHPGRVQTSGPLIIMTFSVSCSLIIRSLLSDIVDISRCFVTFYQKLSEYFHGIFPEKYAFFSRKSLEKFRTKFVEISQLTALAIIHFFNESAIRL